MDFYTATHKNEQLFLAGLDIQESIFKKRLTEMIFDFLKQNVSVSTGSVVDVAPHPRQYFSKASRFVVLSVQGNVDRDSQTGLFNSIYPVLNGVFLDDEGKPFQPPTTQANALPEGSYYQEQIRLTGTPLCVVGSLSENQLHLINIPD